MLKTSGSAKRSFRGLWKLASFGPEGHKNSIRYEGVPPSGWRVLRVRLSDRMRWRREDRSRLGVLIFVHEDVIEPFVQESDECLVAKQMKPIEEEIVVIEHMSFLTLLRNTI